MIVHVSSSLLAVMNASKSGFHKANFDHDNDQFRVKTKRLVGRMTGQPDNRFVFCVVVVELSCNYTMRFIGYDSIEIS